MRGGGGGAGGQSTELASYSCRGCCRGKREGLARRGQRINDNDDSPAGKGEERQGIREARGAFDVKALEVLSGAEDDDMEEVAVAGGESEGAGGKDCVEQEEFG